MLTLKISCIGGLDKMISIREGCGHSPTELQHELRRNQCTQSSTLHTQRWHITTDADELLCGLLQVRDLGKGCVSNQDDRFMRDRIVASDRDDILTDLIHKDL